MPGYQHFSAFVKGLKEIRYGYSFLLMQKFEIQDESIQELQFLKYQPKKNFFSTTYYAIRCASLSQSFKSISRVNFPRILWKILCTLRNTFFFPKINDVYFFVVLFSRQVMSDSFETPSTGFPRQEHGVACHFLLQGFVPTQGSNPNLLYYRWILYCWALGMVN